MQQQPRLITYRDELLADRSVRRIYSDGRQEWRRRRPDGMIDWQDSAGFRGTDELLGDGIIKRSFSNGRVVYAREQGYGRTAWADGGVVTVNQSSFGGQVGLLLSGLGAGLLLGALVPPPQVLSLEEEEALRQKARETSSGGGSGSDAGDDQDSDTADAVGAEGDGWSESGGASGDWDDSDFG